MSTRSRRGEPLPEIPIPAELQDRKPIKVKASVAGTEYVTDPTCETDADGLKGEVFLNYIYRQLRVLNDSSSSSSSSDRPCVYIMIGPPASGKSSIKRTFNINNYVNIDLDEIKKILTKCFPNDPSLEGFAVIGYLKYFARELLKLGIRDRINIIFDTTGRMTDFTTEIIDATRAADYKQIFAIVYTSLENCIARAKSRNISELDRPPMSERKISESYQDFINKGASTGTISYYLLANSELTDGAEELYIFDNNGAEPEILFRRINGVVDVAKDTPNFYNMSILTSEPYFILKTKRKGGKRIDSKMRTRKNKQNKHRKTRK
jgi:hypothetical protein